MSIVRDGTKKISTKLKNFFSGLKTKKETKKETKRKFQDAMCPTPPTPTVSEQSQKAGQIAAAMGVKSCDTQQMSGTFQGNVNLFLASAKMQATMNSTSTVGCEQLYISAETFNQSQQNITCIIKKSQATVQKTLSAGNKISFKAGRDMQVSCSTLNITQSISLKFVDLTQLTNSEVAQITNEAKATISKVSSILQDSTSGLGATPQGQKILKDYVTNINNVQYSQAVTEAINNVQVTLSTNNDITIESGRDLFISGTQCTIDQDIIIDVVSSTILTDTVNRIMSNIGDTVATSDEITGQAGINAGAESLQQDIFSDNNTNTLILAAMFVIIIVAGAYLLATHPELLEQLGKK